MKRRESASSEEGDFVVTEEFIPDSLYIMENPRIPGEVKIGRSQNPEERAKNNFRIVVKLSYREKGYLEKTLRQRLKRRRVVEGSGGRVVCRAGRHADQSNDPGIGTFKIVRPQ